MLTSGLLYLYLNETTASASSCELLLHSRSVRNVVQSSPSCASLKMFVHSLHAACHIIKHRLNTHTHTCITALFPGLPGWAGTRKVKPIRILLKQETVSGSGISWAICKSASRSRQIIMPVPHYSSFLQVGCPSCHPTKSIKALQTKTLYKSSTGVLLICLPEIYWKFGWSQLWTQC